VCASEVDIPDNPQCKVHATLGSHHVQFAVVYENIFNKNLNLHKKYEMTILMYKIILRRKKEHCTIGLFTHAHFMWIYV